MDLFDVPTLTFGLLYALIIVRLDRRDLVWIYVARQITEAFPWNEAPLYPICDRDGVMVLL